MWLDTIDAMRCRIPRHYCYMARCAAGIKWRASAFLDLTQDRSNALIGEAEPDPDQMAAVCKCLQRSRKLAWYARPYSVVASTIASG